MGIDAIPLRTQPDRRLVRLVREGYESAFEEIVRRYRRPLDRFAASIVGGRSEDVTQDSFRKALEALRRDEGEIDLRPWLYRIVRNTALNDLRDRPPAAAELADDLLAGGRSAAVEAEQRAEVAALTAKLRALPENQRAALVMRELEGMGHEEIAAALGISGGAARQAIARARTALRGGLGALVPLPLLRMLAGGGDAASEVAGGVGAAGVGGAGIGGATLFGGGAALKVGLATVAVAGGIGAGVAIDHHRGAPAANPPRTAVERPTPTASRGRPAADRVPPPPTVVVDRRTEDHHRGDRRHGSDSGRGHGSGDGRRAAVEREVEAEHAVVVPTVIDESGAKAGESGDGPGPSRTGGSHGTSGRSGGGRSGDDGSGHGDDDSGAASGGSRHSGSDGGSSGSGGSGSGPSGSGSGGHGSDDLTEAVAEAPTSAPPPVETISSDSSSSGGPGPSSSTSSSGDDGSGSSGGHGSDDDLEISP